MPMPLWWGKINKRIFNPIELRRGKRPTLTHVGRKSGKEYVTPLDAHQIEGGYLFILVYGSECDWVRNILASGTATLRKDGETIELANPRVIRGDEAWPLLGHRAKPPPGLLKIDEFLVMDPA
ncbi:MAG: nitroreductase family deazaflavin-dependent oxidoreductase [Acidimicrobiia bacterium]|nr:nitroreductase family deazaflavin-dependent oxidoreductase [Acidimicrobiia bacterium]